MVSKERVRERQYAVYLLKDEHDIPRYVGITKNPDDRLKRHLREAKQRKTHRQCWIASMLEQDRQPTIEVVAWTDDWDQVEREWIFRLRALGYPLTNGNDGGITMHQARSQNSAESKTPHYKKLMCRIGMMIKGGKYWTPSPELIAKHRRTIQAMRDCRKRYQKAGALEMFDFRWKLLIEDGIDAVHQFDEAVQIVSEKRL